MAGGGSQVIGNKYDAYLNMIMEDDNADNNRRKTVEDVALTELGLKRYCCRRMLLSHVDLIEQLIHYSTLAPQPAGGGGGGGH